MGLRERVGDSRICQGRYYAQFRNLQGDPAGLLGGETEDGIGELGIA